MLHSAALLQVLVDPLEDHGHVHARKCVPVVQLR